MNRAILVGRLGKDPDIRTSQNSKEIMNLSMATPDGYRDKQSGEWVDRSEWHKVVVFNEHIIKFAKEFRKGDEVVVEGKIKTRKWQDQSGADRYATEIVIEAFDGNIRRLRKNEGSQGGGKAQQTKPATQAADSFDPTELDDEIPF